MKAKIGRDDGDSEKNNVIKRIYTPILIYRIKLNIMRILL